MLPGNLATEQEEIDFRLLCRVFRLPSARFIFFCAKSGIALTILISFKNDETIIINKINRIYGEKSCP